VRASVDFEGHAPTDLRLLLDVAKAAKHIREFAVAWSPLTPGDIRELTDALDRLEAQP
jgi:hypothetical protein